LRDEVPRFYVVGEPPEVEPFSFALVDLLAGMFEGREHAEAEEIELYQSERLSVVFIELE
jgi:hypothetical protein